MRIRHLIAEVRGALRVSKISCELSDLDLEAMLREATEEITDRRRTQHIVECTVAKAHHACTEMLNDRATAGRKPRARRKRTARASRKRRADL